jgi:hypothetical protein
LEDSSEKNSNLLSAKKKKKVRKKRKKRRDLKDPADIPLSPRHSHLI